MNPWTAARQASLSITNSQSLLRLISIESVIPSHPLLSPFPHAFNLSQNQGLFQCLHKKSTKHFLKFLVKCLRGMRSPVAISQFSSVAQSCPILCDPMNHSASGLPVHHQLPQFTQTHVHRIGDAFSHLILCCPLLLLPPIPPSIRVFANESTLRMRWQKYWVSASAPDLPMNTQD